MAPFFLSQSRTNCQKREIALCTPKERRTKERGSMFFLFLSFSPEASSVFLQPYLSLSFLFSLSFLLSLSLSSIQLFETLLNTQQSPKRSKTEPFNRKQTQNGGQFRQHCIWYLDKHYCVLLFKLNPILGHPKNISKDVKSNTKIINLLLLLRFRLNF